MENSEAGGTGELSVLPQVQKAIRSRSPVVALESAVITHGLPVPRNLEMALHMESAVAAEGATAATVAVISGRIHVGLTRQQIETLAQSGSTHKIGVRDLAAAAVNRTSGGTTVASTMFAAKRAGICVFATGGIGGVHRESAFDISADIAALSNTSMIVICAGAKSILDLRATVELLETMSVPVVGYRTDEFPAFYSRTSGIGVSVRLESAAEIAEFWAAHQSLSVGSAVLVVNPIPEESAIPQNVTEGWINQASAEASEQGIRGQALTPFLLERLGQLSDARSIEANMALLLNNARLAARIAVAVANQRKSTEA